MSCPTFGGNTFIQIYCFRILFNLQCHSFNVFNLKWEWTGPSGNGNTTSCIRSVPHTSRTFEVVFLFSQQKKQTNKKSTKVALPIIWCFYCVPVVPGVWLENNSVVSLQSQILRLCKRRDKIFSFIKSLFKVIVLQRHFL